MKRLYLLLLPLILYTQDLDHWLEQANDNNRSAQLKAAQFYEKNNDTQQALYWYKKAALNDKKGSLKVKNGFDDSLVHNVTKELEDNSTKESILQILTSNFGLYPYKKNYILPFTYDFKDKDDRKKFETFFQLSFMIPLANDYFNLNETINLGYTQKSWWQTSKDSAPFRETNYQPEIFMNLPMQNEDIKSLKMLRFGLLHNSNGQSGIDSRSLNALYLQGFFQFQNLFINLKNWYRIPENEKTSINDTHGDDNPDYIDYYGDGEIQIKYFIANHLLSAKYRYAFSHLDRGALSLGWSFPIHENIFGFFNYFYGYGESLIDYDKKVQRAGFGIQFTR